MRSSAQQCALRSTAWSHPSIKYSDANCI